LTRISNEHGTALLIAITLALIAFSFRESRELLYSAEGAVALAIRDLGQPTDWSAVLSGAAASSFTDGASIGSRTLPGGTVITLCCTAGSLTADVQQRAHGGRNWGGDTPQWQIFAWGPVSGWLAAGRIDSPVYVGVWVADDPADGDGNPAADTNGVVELHAQALGTNGARRVVQVLLSRPSDAASPGVRILSWREARW
jgi:hypothetical protein